MQAHIGRMGAHGLHREGDAIAGLVLLDVRIHHTIGVAVGETEIQTDFSHAIEFVFWRIVTHPVTAMVGEPEFLGDGVPVKTHGVTHATGNHFHVGAIGIVAADLRVFLGGQLADIARRAKGHVELAVRAEADVLPVVVLLGRQLEVGGQIDRLHRGVLLNTVKAQYLVDRHHVERAVMHGHCWLVQLVDDDAAGALLAVVRDLVDTAKAAGAHVDLATLAPGHRSPAGCAMRPDLGLEAGRQLQFVQRNIARRRHRELARHRCELGVRHGGRAALLPCGWWRCRLRQCLACTEGDK